MSQIRKLEKRSEEETLQNKREIDSLIAEAFKYIKSIAFRVDTKSISRGSNKRVGKERSRP